MRPDSRRNGDLTSEQRSRHEDAAGRRRRITDRRRPDKNRSKVRPVSCGPSRLKILVMTFVVPLTLLTQSHSRILSLAVPDFLAIIRDCNPTDQSGTSITLIELDRPPSGGRENDK